MSDDLVSDLRLNAEHQLLSVEDYRRAADRIEKLEAALRLCVCNCEKNCTDDNDDICEGWVCRKALEGKDER